MPYSYQLLSNSSPNRIMVSVRWLNFRERGLDGVKSPYTNLQTSKIVKPKMKKKEIEILKTIGFANSITIYFQMTLTNFTILH